MPNLNKTLLASALSHSIRADAQHGGIAKIPGRLEVKAAVDDQAELLVYGDIGESWWSESVTALNVVKQLNEITAKTINVRINSYGGSVSDGLAIYNALKRHAATINVTIDGVAASIASLIAMAGDTITMPANTWMMVHAPWGEMYVSGNAKDVREASEEFAQILDVFAKSMAQSYASKTGKPYDEMFAMVTDGADHYMTAAEAKTAGFCDEVLNDANAVEDAQASLTRIGQQGAFAKYIERMPAQIAANFRKPKSDPTAAPAAAVANPPASAGAQAAPSAATPTGALPMPDTQKTAEQVQADKDQKTAINAAVTAQVQALQTRNVDIRAMAEPHFGNPEIKSYVDKVIAEADPSVTAENVGKQILALMAKGAEPLNGNARVIAGADQRDVTRKAMSNAIEARAGLMKADGENPYRGHSMAELAREALVQAGVNTRGMDRREIVGLAFTHSTSDFPGLLSDSARKSALKGYEEAEEVIDQFTRAVSVPDFKPTNLAGLGAFSDLLVVPEGSEFKYGTFSEQSQAMKIVTFGRLFSVTRQAIINDDLSVFTEVPRKLGQAARRTIASEVFKLINTNPILADGFALFSAEHGNLLTGSDISTTSVDVMRQSFALQKDADGNTIRVPLKTLLVPVTKGGLARTVKTSQYEVSGSKNLTTPNIVKDTFEVVDDGRLDAASAAAWYGIANPAVIDGIVIGYLDGNQTPYIEEEQGFTVDGVAWKVRIDAAPAIADYRGLRKNPGA